MPMEREYTCSAQIQGALGTLGGYRELSLLCSREQYSSVDVYL